MSSRGQYLFVYGTLLPGRAPAEIAPIVQRLRAVGDGFIRGHMYNLGAYPGAVLDEGGEKIRGKIFRLPPEPEILERLDKYEEFDEAQPEGSLFLRKKWPVTRTDGKRTLTCWIYVYNPHAGTAPAITREDISKTRNGRVR
ncbi:MAG: gamma-glutamylcyclotransferase family protein [Candidatus Sulfotelmatobacter sp.]